MFHIGLVFASSSVKREPLFRQCFIHMPSLIEEHSVKLLLLLLFSFPSSYAKQLKQCTSPNPSNPKPVPVGGPHAVIVNSSKVFISTRCTWYFSSVKLIESKSPGDVTYS